jgi:hypothetical protein
MYGIIPHHLFFHTRVCLLLSSQMSLVASFPHPYLTPPDFIISSIGIFEENLACTEYYHIFGLLKYK